MKIKTIENKVNGELAIRGMSDKAKNFYNESDPIEVYEYDDESGNKLYAYDGAFGYSEGLTFQELQNCFEDMQDDFEGLE